MNASGVDFKSLHDQFRPRVLRYVTRLVGEAEADDVTQSAMVKVNEGLAGFRGDSSVSTWIYRIATNVAMDKLRQRATQPLTDTEYEFDEDNLPSAARSSPPVAGNSRAGCGVDRLSSRRMARVELLIQFVA